MNKIIILLLISISALTSCKEKSETIITDSKPEPKITYVVGLFEGQVRACVGCDDYQQPHIWVTPIIEFNSFTEIEKAKQMDKWEDKFRQIFPGIKIIDRDVIIGDEYIKVSNKRREYLSPDNSSSTDAIPSF